MEIIYHFYIIEAILAIILVYLLLLLIDRKDKQIVHQNDSNALLKYKALRKKHFALLTMLDKIIVEKIELKQQINQLSENSLALEAENKHLTENYNKAITTLDRNEYPSNLKSHDKINKGLNKWKTFNDKH